MPTTIIHPPDPNRSSASDSSSAGLPQLLQTPSGLAIVEIQGSLNVPTSTSRPPGAAAPVGKLVFPDYKPDQATDDTSWHKRVYLYVGRYQRLTGEIKTLAKPLAVIRRRAESVAADSEDLEIAEIVYYKLLFASRPEPVGGGSE